MVNYLYIHIPFCIKKCIYCDFYSIPFKSQVAEDYVNALCKEIELRKHAARDIGTVFIGGGTPTVISGNEISKILNKVKETFSVRHDAEVTIEANPGTITEGKLAGLREAGVNRISIGIQSLDDHELTVLGRSHTSDDVLYAVTAARKAGFNNISVDLIYGIPGQNMETWVNTLLKAIELLPEHVSTYELTPEKNTPLSDDIKKGRLALPDEEIITEMYYKGIDILQAHGYAHYEISNFARPGYQCIHNLNYWNRGEYLGIGAGAHSFLNGRRTANVRDVFRYVESVNSGMIAVAEDIEITAKEALKELIFLGLRKTEGIDMSRMPDIAKMLKSKAVDELIRHGLLETRDNCLCLTRKGLVLSNEIILRIFEEL
ncbi:MAG: radical SAM family heme chaperone HemW [Nitrospirae bacterium]|nr:radical SAM family heme chaperone HemW [Nitrospirota bacterium]